MRGMMVPDRHQPGKWYPIDISQGNAWDERTQGGKAHASTLPCCFLRLAISFRFVHIRRRPSDQDPAYRTAESLGNGTKTNATTESHGASAKQIGHIMDPSGKPEKTKVREAGRCCIVWSRRNRSERDGNDCANGTASPRAETSRPRRRASIMPAQAAPRGEVKAARSPWSSKANTPHAGPSTKKRPNRKPITLDVMPSQRSRQFQTLPANASRTGSDEREANAKGPPCNETGHWARPKFRPLEGRSLHRTRAQQQTAAENHRGGGF